MPLEISEIGVRLSVADTSSLPLAQSRPADGQQSDIMAQPDGNALPPAMLDAIVARVLDAIRIRGAR
jgi:hypothetical protein